MTNTSLLKADRTLVMGVLNVTPDSFSDGGLSFGPDSAIARARALIDEGADILDIGGESTRPGSEPVSAEEELRRIVPVIDALAGHAKVPISIDTCKPRVADECLRRGARILNDVTGLRDEQMLRVAAKHGASVVIMHMRGTPKLMQQLTEYKDVVREVKTYLANQAAAARNAGLTDIAVDPGIGFSKTPAHNFEILRRLGEFRELGYALLVGPSRKSFLGVIEGQKAIEDRLEGTIAAVTIAVLHGADIVRVHDVKACRRGVGVAERVRKA